MVEGLMAAANAPAIMLPLQHAGDASLREQMAAVAAWQQQFGQPLIEVRDLHDPAPRPASSGSAAGAALAGGQAGFPIPALSEPPH